MDMHISSTLGRHPVVKIVVIGASQVGKSSLIDRFANNTFSHSANYNFANNSMQTKVSIDGITCILDICEQDQSKSADVALLIYDITSKQSFDYIRSKLNNQQIPMVVAANKLDLSHYRQIDEKDGISLCKMVNIPFYEVCATNGLNVKQCFYECFREHLMRKMTQNKYSFDDEQQYEMKKNHRKKSKKYANSSMDIKIAVIGTHSVGKTAMTHSFIDRFGQGNIKKSDSYFTSIKTSEKMEIEHAMQYKEYLDLTLNVYCIEYSEKKSLCMDYNDERHRKCSEQRNKWIVTPSKSYLMNASLPSPICLNANMHSDTNYFDELNCDDSDPQYGHLLNMSDITKANDAFLFVASMTDKDSFIQCIDYIQSLKNDSENYNYSKPIIVVVTKCDLPNGRHQLTEQDIAEFAIDIAVPFVLITPNDYNEPFNRAIAAIRGYWTPSCFTKVRRLHQFDGAVHAMIQSANGKYLYVGGYDGSIRIYDIQTSICVAIILFHTGKIYKLQCHTVTLSRQWWKPCRYLISCSADGICAVWLLFNRVSNISSRSEIVHNVMMKKDFYGVVNAEMVANNGNIPLFINCPRFVFKHNGKIRSFCICDGNVLCTIGDDERIKLRSLVDGQCLFDSGNQKLGILNDVVYIKEYDKLYVASKNHCVYLLNVKDVIANKDKIKILHGHSDSVTHLKVCKKSNYEIYIISIDESGFICCRNAKSPQRSYMDFMRCHFYGIESAAICNLKKEEYDWLLIVTSKNGTMQSYAIPNGQIVFNIADSLKPLKAVDSNQNFTICAGRDCNVGCYEFGSNKSELPQFDVCNPLQVGLKWQYRRHESSVNRVLCGKKRFKHMVFSADSDGIILGWNMQSGECLACFGSNRSRNKAIKYPKRQVRAEFVFMIAQFLQLMVLGFAIDSNVEWSEFNEAYNPFAIISDFVLFDCTRYEKYLFDFINFEWLISVFLIGIFVIFYYISQQNVDFGTQQKEDTFYAILSVLNYLVTKVAFIPILRSLLKIFVCDYMSRYLDECFSSQHWIYIIVTFIMLLSLLFIHFKQIKNCQKEQKRVHFASQRQNVLVFLNEFSIIIMVISSVLSLDVSYVTFGILFACSAILCLSALINPPFYSSKMNIFAALLYFGVFWTYIWSLFVINKNGFAQMIEFIDFDKNEMDKMETMIHLCILPPFMLFGALLMFIRSHSKWYDEIRGGFRAKLIENGIGFISENVNSIKNRKESGKIILKQTNCPKRSNDAFFKFHKMKNKKEYQLQPQMDESEDCEMMQHTLQNYESNSISAPQYSYRQSIHDLYPPTLRQRVFTNSLTANNEQMQHHNSVDTKNNNNFALNALQERDDNENENEVKSEETSMCDYTNTVILHRNTVCSETCAFDDEAETVITFDTFPELPKRKETNAEDRDEFVLSAESFTKSPVVSINVNNHLDVPQCDSMRLEMKSETNESEDYYESIAMTTTVTTNILIDSNRSNVTTFSAMEEIPDNIGDIFD